MADNAVIDNIINMIATPILIAVKWFFNAIFSNDFFVFIFYFLLINLIAIILMKKDKEHAEKDERRIRETTLMIVALVGGAIRNVLCNV